MKREVDRDGVVDLVDVFCVLDGFVGTFTKCTLEDLDIGRCGGDGRIDIFDILGVLDAFVGIDPCVRDP